MGLGEIGQECARLEEDAIHSSKAHFATAARWSAVHLFLGIPSTLVAAVAGVSALQRPPRAAGVPALTVFLLPGISTVTLTLSRAPVNFAGGSRAVGIRMIVDSNDCCFRGSVLEYCRLDRSKCSLLLCR